MSRQFKQENEQLNYLKTQNERIRQKSNRNLNNEIRSQVQNQKKYTNIERI